MRPPMPYWNTPEAAHRIFPVQASRIGERVNRFAIPPAAIAYLEPMEETEVDGIRLRGYTMMDMTSVEVFTMRVTKDGKIAGVDLRSR